MIPVCLCGSLLRPVLWCGERVGFVCGDCKRVFD